ncbi:hypothetical protein BDF20DRAFT_941034 [Mycotypha africana]|uniref:uncharacterized protein n=1 Tax=Mycotypha africana TaxID=64632 RepID=UPI002301AD4F|nr:uncharacterized protein BDF20DRAFT_941034 [Mycotypha africana]KAI8979835.1 hypothetical protein BDF20DRAFT_941034 [Mycotypha africana]
MIDIRKETVWPTTSPRSSNSSSSSLEISDDRSFPPELLQSLKQHSLFQRAKNESFLEKIACCMHLRTYSPRDVIIVEGEPAKAMFFLLRGSVDVCSKDYERIYATLPKGSCFGEIGILYSMPRTATVIASTKCIVASLTADEVNSILPQYPEVEKVLRFEAEERLTLLRKSKNLNDADKVTQKPLTERNVEDFRSANNLLQTIPYFQNCPEEFLHSVSLKVEPRHYAPNDLILRKGEQGNELFFIINGTVEIANIDSAINDPFTPVARLSAGDYFGDISVLLNAPRPADVKAVTPIELYVLNKTDFIDVISRFPNLQNHLKTMAETSLNNLRQKKSGLEKGTVFILPVSPIIPTQSSAEITSTSVAGPVITLDSICSTTSDQDPTLLPPTTVTNVLKQTETRRRRASVAIWSDPHLVALANKNLKTKHDELEKSSLKEDIVINDEIMQPARIAGDGCLELFHEDILAIIINYLDFLSILRFSTVSKRCREFIRHSHKILQHVDLAPLHKLITDNAAKAIAEVVGNRPRRLSLSQCFYITDDGFENMIKDMKNVEAMDLNSCWLLTDRSLNRLAEACPHLTKLDLSNCRKISDIGIFKLLDRKAAYNYPQLEELRLSYCKKLTDMAMGHLVEFCSQTLRSLNIQRCTRITDQGFKKWADSTAPFSSLQYLNLTDCSFLTDQAVAYLVAAAPNLKDLSLSFCCALSDRAIESLISLPQLTSLDASFCGAAISDISIKQLLSSISIQNLSSLNLRGCVRITDLCIETILNSVHINQLNISQCPGISLEAKRLIQGSNIIKQLVV